VATGEREIVEAAPMDKIWGIGFGWKNAEKKEGALGIEFVREGVNEG